jgi:hypothetical protein
MWSFWPYFLFAYYSVFLLRNSTYKIISTTISKYIYISLAIPIEISSITSVASIAPTASPLTMLKPCNALALF